LGTPTLSGAPGLRHDGVPARSSPELHAGVTGPTAGPHPDGRGWAVHERAARSVPEEASKGTKGDLVDRARQLGYAVAADPTQLQQATGLQLGLFANEEGTEADDETGTGDSVDDGPFPVAGGTAQFVLDWTTTGHTDVPVPVTAEGPGAETLTGQHPNTSVHEVLARTLGIRT
jgi:alkaline phosphatase